LDYSNTEIRSVTDFTLRTWSYTVVSDPGTTQPFYLTQVVDPLAGVDTYAYVAINSGSKNLSTAKDPAGSVYTYGYYPNGNVFEVIDPVGSETHVSFNLFRNRTSFVDERDNLTQYDFDNNGMVLKVLYADGASEAYTWQNSLMKSFTD